MGQSLVIKTELSLYSFKKEGIFYRDKWSMLSYTQCCAIIQEEYWVKSCLAPKHVISLYYPFRFAVLGGIFAFATCSNAGINKMCHFTEGRYEANFFEPPAATCESVFQLWPFYASYFHSNSWDLMINPMK